MSSEASLAHRSPAELRPDPARVIAQLFLPGEELPGGRSRAGAVVERVHAIPEEDLAAMVAQIEQGYAHRHHNFFEVLAQHAAIVSSHSRRYGKRSPDRTLVIGAAFTAEYCVEGAALCNPSTVEHPDQTGTVPGQIRVAVSLRAIGEGHISTLGFASALIGPGEQWVFEPRALPAVAGTSAVASWQREHLRSVLADQGRVDGLAHSILSSLPDTFTGADLQAAVESTPPELIQRMGGHATVDLLRQLVESAYRVSFPDDVELSQRVLRPTAPEERNGLEDARFVRFEHEDATIDYRATYTAYDGRNIAPRLLITRDLQNFEAHRLAGAAARNKGMALFPRLVGGKHLALCRSDGESTSITTSTDGFVWHTPEPVQQPMASWELLQVGNCGPPIETAEGWLVLTHGVGPMRAYAIGALLLDLDDPRKVLKRLQEPLLTATEPERNGYVPNVVYSCGGIAHDGLLWIPYGIADTRIGVMWVSIAELLAAMS